jgi:chromosome partitioning protein
MANMKTVAVESQKGGSGKTTTTLNLAVAAGLTGKTAVVIDLDPQASAAGWKDTRRAEAPVVVSVAPARLSQALQAAQEGDADLALIDTAPHAEGAALAAAKAADLILIPTRPGILDLRAIGTTADLAKIAGKPAFVVLNAIPPGATRLIEDARAAAAVHGLEVAPVVIEQRAALSHSLTAGQTAQEYDPQGKAAEEIARLYDWLRSQLWQ